MVLKDRSRKEKRPLKPEPKKCDLFIQNANLFCLSHNSSDTVLMIVKYFFIHFKCFRICAWIVVRVIKVIDGSLCWPTVAAHTVVQHIYRTPDLKSILQMCI